LEASLLDSSQPDDHWDLALLLDYSIVPGEAYTDGFILDSGEHS
jgi:hypothetical protein